MASETTQRHRVFDWTLVVLVALFEVYAALIMKQHANAMSQFDFSSALSIQSTLWQLLFSPLLLSAIFCYFLAPVLWFLALNRLDLSQAYPVLVCLHLVFVLWAGVGFLGENLTLNKAIGCVLLLSSLACFYGEKEKALIQNEEPTG